MSTSNFALSLDFTGFTGTFTNTSAVLTVSGSVTMGSGMTMTAGSGGGLTINGAGTLTCNGISISPNTVIINAPGLTVQLGGAFIGGGGLTITAGTFTTNNYSITIAGNFSSSNSNVRTLNLGSSVITLNGGGSISLTTVTNLTFNVGTSTFKCLPGITGMVINSGVNLNNVWMANRGTLQINSSITFNDIKVDTAGAILIIGQGITATVATLTIAGTALGSLIGIQGQVTGSQSTISRATGSQSVSWAWIKDMAFTGGATFSASNSIDVNNNSGITITPPGGGASGMLYVPNLEGT